MNKSIYILFSITLHTLSCVGSEQSLFPYKAYKCPSSSEHCFATKYVFIKSFIIPNITTNICHSIFTKNTDTCSNTLLKYFLIKKMIKQHIILEYHFKQQALEQQIAPLFQGKSKRYFDLQYPFCRSSLFSLSFARENIQQMASIGAHEKISIKNDHNYLNTEKKTFINIYGEELEYVD